MSSSEEPSQTSQSNQTPNESAASETPEQISDPSVEDPKTVENLESTDKEDGAAQGEEGEGEEEGECGFCLFMKGGGCRESFISWENCVEEAEKNKEDIVEKCFEVTGALKKCMEAHSDYYAPILQAEKAAEEEVGREIAREKEREKAGGSEEHLTVEVAVSEGDDPKVLQKD